MRMRLLERLLIVLLLAALTWIPAMADLIWEPNDSFYEQVRDDAVYHNRGYTANGKDGAVTIQKEPGSDDIVASVNNGNEFYVSFIYTDTNGAEWGVVEFNPDGAGNLGGLDYSTAKSGWILMTDLTVIYDYISFAEDHGSEFKPYTGTYEEFRTGGKVVFWKYPGSGIVDWENDAFDSDHFEISDTYTDSENRLWGFISYYLGSRNVWVCISDPSGEDIEKVLPSAIPEPMPVSPGVELQVRQKGPTSVILLIAAIVAAVVVVTGVLIAVFWKKSAKKHRAVK